MKTHPEPVQSEKTAAGVVLQMQALMDAALTDQLAVLRQNGCALLDFPDHGNVGDSAIWMGQIAWLDRNRVACKVSGSLHMDLAEIRALPPAVPLLLHGGGNFGDLWVRHQLFRERILAEFPDRQVIQLPQSIHYDDPSLIGRTGDAIARHPRFLLLVRDQPSLRLAQDRFACEVRLCPDMAFALGMQERPTKPDLQVLMLLRSDGERRNDQGEIEPPDGWLKADWLEDAPDLWSGAKTRTLRKTLLSFRPGRMNRPALRRAYLDELAKRRVDRGLRLLARARYVITDRLHVHILCSLLDIPHCVLDNRYGKIARLMEAFGTRWSGVSCASTLSQAAVIARDHLESRTIPAC